MKRFTKINDNNGELEITQIDSTAYNDADYIYDNKEKYFVKGRPDAQKAEELINEISQQSI